MLHIVLDFKLNKCLEIVTIFRSVFCLFEIQRFYYFVSVAGNKKKLNMLAARFCQIALAPATRISVSRAVLYVKPATIKSALSDNSSCFRTQFHRSYADESRLSRIRRRRTLKEAALEPAGDTGKSASLPGIFIVYRIVP